MNWGKSIFLSFVLFAAFILFMVVRAFQEDFDLVAEDYYAQEINYQKKLEQKANLVKLDQRVLLTQVKQSITLEFPQSQNPEGEIHFYHPFRKMFDKKIPILMGEKNTQIIDSSELVMGQYRVNITWKSGGEEYFQQDKIFIQ